MKSKLIILASLIILSVFSLSQADVQYIVTDLGTLGGDSSNAFGINDSGQVVGQSRTESGVIHAFLSDGTANSMIDLGTLGGNNSFAMDINNSGMVVGCSEYTSNNVNSHAFLYDGTKMIDLGTFPGNLPDTSDYTGNYSHVSGINNNGQITGTSRTENGFLHAFMSDSTANNMTDLGTLGGTFSLASGINDSEQVVGYSSLPGDATAGSAFLFDGTANTMTDLGTLGGVNSRAYGINNSGQVVGASHTGSGFHAFLYNGTDMSDLGTLGGDVSTAYDINDSGQIVGNGDIIGNEEPHAFLYDEIRGMLDLNDLISNTDWELNFASAINASGQIVGRGIIDGQQHAYLLTPVPEPATLLLLGLGGLLLRKRKP